MRDLISNIDPNAWTIWSSVVFLAAFVVMTVWTYLPSRKGFYNDKSKLPISE